MSRHTPSISPRRNFSSTIRTNRRRRWIGATAAGAALLAAVGAGSALGASTPPPPDVATDGVAASTGLDRGSAILQLAGAPLSTDSRTAPARGKRLDVTTAPARTVRAELAEQRNRLRTWLRSNAPAARITGEYDIAVNAVAVRLNGTPLEKVRSAPGVISGSYGALYAPLAHEDPDLALIDAPEGWALAGGGATTAGAGVRVGIIDSGIDVMHPCFDDEGFPAAVQEGDRRFTNNKVVVAKVFNNQAVSRGLTAEAVNSHGTHVAGTVACNAHTPAAVQGAIVGYDASGVAPGALLGSYNVFPGTVAGARSEDILDALDAAAGDGMTVINMSLGGGASGIQDLLSVAVDNLDRASIVTAVSAGNSGPGRYTVGSPGSAERALTAGASTVGHFVGAPIRSGGAEVAIAAAGDFPVPAADVTGLLAAVPGSPLGTGCVATDFPAMAGAVALISRGACTFGTKVANAERAGAVAAVIVNNDAGDPIGMGTDPAYSPVIPAVMAALDERDALLALSGRSVTLGVDRAYTTTGNDNIMAQFSSQGPTDVDLRIKPDVVAPGVNVLSSVPSTSCDDPAGGCWAFFQGTSMASPHLAGMAAVVRQARPAWDAWQVRSAIVNTAQQSELTKSTAISTRESAVQVVGAGLADLDAAVGAQIALSSVSTSFGAVPAGSGRTLTKTVSVTNLTAEALTLPVSVEGEPGVFSVGTGSLTLPAGSSATIHVRFTTPRTPGERQATLRIGDAAHAALFGLVR